MSELRLYEFALVLVPDLGYHEIDNVIKKLFSIVSDSGGSMVKTFNWGLRDTKFPIKKYTKAYYYFLNVKCSDTTIDECVRRLKLSESVLRHMCLQTEDVFDESMFTNIPV